MPELRFGSGDPLYPPLLREIPHPPQSLYVRGAWTEDAQGKTAIAVVGTRKATSEGRALARKFAAAFARAGAVVVSGLAFGVDAAAHAGALEAGGTTWAVLATGTDEVYPRSHAQLADRILAGGGALLSEYPHGTPAFQSQFLARNRIVSGLSRAIVIIEAPHRSGALATARFALDQNRDIFAVPGPAAHPNYGGSHRLIRAGATLVTSPEEVLEDLGLATAGAALRGSESETEEAIVHALRTRSGGMTIDELAAAATLSASEANQAVTMLVLRGLVEEEAGQYVVGKLVNW